jgi:hypothetical protein
MDVYRAFSDDLVRVVKCDDRRNTYSLKFGTLKTTVIIKVFQLDFRLFDCIQSHYINTAGQLGPYISSHTSFESKGLTLHRAISKFTFYYRKSVEQGYLPQEGWLWPALGWSETNWLGSGLD